MSPEELEFARVWLGRFVLGQAERTAREVGFGWEVSDLAPDSYPALVKEFAACQRSGRALRVAAVNQEPNIFGSAQVNAAMRFWHDVTHVQLAKDFGFAGEMAVAKAHLRAVEEAGAVAGSLAWQLLRIDTVGQNLVFTLTGGGFVSDQWMFTERALAHGLPMAVLLAVEDLEARPVNSGEIATLTELLEQERDA